MKAYLKQIQQSLKENIDEKTLQMSPHFFKEEVKSYGVKIPVVNSISKSIFDSSNPPTKEQLFNLSQLLWQSGYLEETFIACNLIYEIKEQYQPQDLAIFYQWLNQYVNNWASCDTLCNHTIAAFIEKYPDEAAQLQTWTTSNNRWVKRGAAVTFIIPARKGLFKELIFSIADALLLDKDDLVQKGYGWMLKSASEAYQQDVFNYVINKKAVMPRTSLRYAIQKMPDNLKKLVMAK